MTRAEAKVCIEAIISTWEMCQNQKYPSAADIEIDAEDIAALKIAYKALEDLDESLCGFEEGYQQGRSERTEKVAVWREVPVSDENPYFSKIRCSNCKTETFGAGYKYCPGCGCKMRYNISVEV